MKEFEEIAHTGGKITFSNRQTKYEHCNPHNIIMYDIAVSFNGIILGRVPFDKNAHPLPAPSITIMMASDKEGFFGYTCPRCHQYFRACSLPEIILCPYCLYIGNAIKFLTNNQLQYIALYLNKLNEHLSTQKEICIDLDEIINQLTQNTINFRAFEERQQLTVICEKCAKKFDIIGLYASCPTCGYRNNFSQFLASINKIRHQMKDPAPDLNKLLTNSIDEYSGMGSDIQCVLEQNIPLCSAYKKEIKKIDFQKIIETNKILTKLYGLKLFEDTDAQFLSHMFQKRHLITHRSGIVDQKYLSKTNGTSVRLGQKISINANELDRFLGMLEHNTKKFFDQFCSILDDYIQKK